jgi:uracil-DNA glycosylase
MYKIKSLYDNKLPYHDGSFNGLAFGNGQKHGPWPKRLSPSLKHILQEVERTEGAKPDPDLYLWAEEGVLLINTAHTVVEGIAGSHLELWRPFTAEVISALNKKTDLVWMLWGGKAKGYKDQINPNHKILEAGHPSPLNSVIPFMGCGHFKECNEYFESKKQDPITWAMPF